MSFFNLLVELVDRMFVACFYTQTSVFPFIYSASITFIKENYSVYIAHLYWEESL